MSALDPAAVNTERAVAHAGDEVYEVVVAVRLCQPDGVEDLALKAALAQVDQRARGIVTGHEQVEIFGIAPYAGVVLQRKCARDGVRNLALSQQIEGVAKQLELLLRKFRRRGGTDRQRSLSSHPRFDDGCWSHGCGTLNKGTCWKALRSKLPQGDSHQPEHGWIPDAALFELQTCFKSGPRRI